MARPGEGGERLRDPKCAVDAADAQHPALKRGPQRLHRRIGRPESTPQQRSADLGIGAKSVWAPALRRRVTGRCHPAADLGGRLGLGGREGAHPHRMHLDS
jgi:hypothetical protein